MSVISKKQFGIKYGMGTNNQSWGMFFSPFESSAFLALIRKTDPKVMIEIGVNNGKTARAVLNEMPGLIRYIGIDVPAKSKLPWDLQNKEVPDEPGQFAWEDPRFVLMFTNPGTLPQLPNADFIYIDGDHSLSGVQRDTKAAFQAIRPGGCVAWHDYQLPGVSKVIDDMNRHPKGKNRIALVEHTNLCFTFDGCELGKIGG